MRHDGWPTNTGFSDRGDGLIADAIEDEVPAPAEFVRWKIRLVVLGRGRGEAQSDANRGENRASHDGLHGGA